MTHTLIYSQPSNNLLEVAAMFTSFLQKEKLRLKRIKGLAHDPLQNSFPAWRGKNGIQHHGIFVCGCVDACAYMYWYMYTCVHTCMHDCMCVYICMYICMCMCTCECMVYMYVMCAYMFVNVYVGVHMCAHLCVNM